MRRFSVRPSRTLIGTACKGLPRSALVRLPRREFPARTAVGLQRLVIIWRKSRFVAVPQLPEFVTARNQFAVKGMRVGVSTPARPGRLQRRQPDSRLVVAVLIPNQLAISAAQNDLHVPQMHWAKIVLAELCSEFTTRIA